MKRFSLFGNCQAQAIRWLLLQSKEFSAQYVEEEIIASYEMNGSECSKFCSDTLPELDLLIMQPHNASISPFHEYSYLRKICSQNSVQVITIPQIYFSAYNPWERNFDGISEQPYADEIRYMDTLLASAVLREVPIGAFLDQTNRLTDRHNEYLRHEFGVCMTYLREVEQQRACDVSVAGYIESQFRQHRLMHSINHPMSSLMGKLARGVLDVLHIRDPLVEVDLFNHHDTIIYPLVAEAMLFDFRSSDDFIAKRHTNYGKFFGNLSSIEFQRVESILRPFLWTE